MHTQYNDPSWEAKGKTRLTPPGKTPPGTWVGLAS